jgi:hypothetical protein
VAFLSGGAQVRGHGLMTDLESDEFYTDRVMKDTYKMVCSRPATPLFT